MLRWLGWAVAVTLIATAAYELALALRREISPNGEGWVLVVAVLAMLANVVLVFLRAGPVWLFAPAAAFFVTARFYTGDPYYEPYFRSYSDGGVFSSVWVLGLLGLAVLAGVAALFWRRTKPVESTVLLILLAFTALFMGTGH
jgi:hypothetical protein